MRHSYKTIDTCATKINFDLDGDIVRNIELSGGCNGNLNAIQTLLDGSTVDQIGSKLSGTLSDRRPTSCVDQLAKAVQNAFVKAQTEI